MTAILQNRAVIRFTKKIVRKNFVLYLTTWMVWICTYKNADEKAQSFFHGEEKRTKTDKE